ncbi:MAG: hypothetical protein K2X47_06635 [Bdellovibrionales bacterium]|nr:hypothetical protein [Bdellovibrionales bacterium]
MVPENDLALRSYEARIVLGDGRLSEALCDLEGKDAIQKLKSLIRRGDVAEAKNLAVGLLETLANTDAPEVQCELHLELARIALYQGEWNQCLGHIQTASSLHPPAVTQVTLWQLEAAALGERGDHAQALRMIEKVESISKVFPGGNVLFYARNQRAKLWIKAERVNEGKRLLSDLWREYVPSESVDLSLDFLETLSRCELALASQTKTDGAAWATLSRRCSREIGDKLFEDIALAEFVLNQKLMGRPVAVILKKNLLCSPFNRVKTIIAENQLEKVETAPNQYCPHEELDFRFCYLSARECVIDLQERRSTSVQRDSVIARALTALSQNSFSVPLEQFFQTLYGLTYVKERHSGIIRTLMTRIRQQTKIEVLSKDGIVSCERAFLVVDTNR